MNIRFKKKTFHIGRVYIICFLVATVISLISIKGYFVIKQDEKSNVNISYEHLEVNQQSKKEASISYSGITSLTGRYQPFFCDMKYAKPQE